MPSRSKTERNARHEQEDQDSLDCDPVVKKFKGTKEYRIRTPMPSLDAPTNILQVETLAVAELTVELPSWRNLEVPKLLDIKRFEVIDTYLMLEFTPDTPGAKPRQISLQQYVGFPLQQGTEGVLLVLLKYVPGKGKRSSSQYMRSSVLEDRLTKDEVKRRTTYLQDSALPHIFTAIDVWTEDGKHSCLERGLWEVTGRRGEGGQYRKWWEFAHNCIRGEANASKRSFIKARFWDGPAPPGTELCFTTSNDIPHDLFDYCLKKASLGLSFKPATLWAGKHGVDIEDGYELLGVHFLDLYRLYVKHKDNPLHKLNYPDLNSHEDQVRAAIGEVRPTNQQARKQVALMLSTQNLEKKLKKLEAHHVYLAEKLRRLRNHNRIIKLKLELYDVTKSIEKTRVALSSTSENAIAYASTNAHAWATITHLSRGKLNGAVAQKRAISQKTAMNGHSATNIAKIFRWTDRPRPHSAKYHAEWLHRSAFSFGGLGIGVRLDSSQSAKNMIFGSVEANTIMIRPEDTIKRLVRHIGGNYNDNAIIGMVTTIAKPLKCGQAGDEYSEDPDPGLRCIWLVKELEYTIHVELSKLAPKHLRGQINDLTYTTTFNPCSRKTPLLLEARLDEEIEKMWFEQKFPKPEAAPILGEQVPKSRIQGSKSVENSEMEEE